MAEVQYTEAKFFMVSNLRGEYSFETYSLLIDSYIKSTEKNIINVRNVDCGEEKREWALRWIDEGLMKGWLCSC